MTVEKGCNGRTDPRRARAVCVDWTAGVDYCSESTYTLIVFSFVCCVCVAACVADCVCVAALPSNAFVSQP